MRPFAQAEKCAQGWDAYLGPLQELRFESPNDRKLVRSFYELRGKLEVEDACRGIYCGLSLDLLKEVSGKMFEALI